MCCYIDGCKMRIVYGIYWSYEYDESSFELVDLNLYRIYLRCFILNVFYVLFLLCYKKKRRKLIILLLMRSEYELVFSVSSFFIVFFECYCYF